MPRIASKTGSWVLQRLELKPVWGKPDLATIGEQSNTVRRDEMRHRVAFPDMAVQPQPAIHRENHPVSATFEFAVYRRDIGGHAGA